MPRGTAPYIPKRFDKWKIKSLIKISPSPLPLLLIYPLQTIKSVAQLAKYVKSIVRKLFVMKSFFKSLSMSNFKHIAYR